MKRFLVLVNPSSHGGRCGTRLAKLQALLPEGDFVVLGDIVEARRRAREASGYETVVACGGDGTVNAVAAGVLENPDPALKFGVIYEGISPDFCRLAAKEGSKTRGLAGVWAQLDYDVRIVRKVSATCFWPRPLVGSSVVRLDRHERNAGLTDAERRMFRSLTKRAFSQRRKQLGRVLKDMVQSTARAEELSNEDWIALTKGVTENEDT